MSAFLRPGIFVSDEIARSSDPLGQALDYAGKLQAFNMDWLALQILPGNEFVASHVKSALKSKGKLFFTWAQGLESDFEKSEIQNYGSQGHICNPENPAQDSEYSDSFLNWLRTSFGYRAVVFTEGAWGKLPDGNYNAAKAYRWRDFIAMPEAFLPENPNWTPPVMVDMAQKFGWPYEMISPSLGIFSKNNVAYHAPHYSPYMAQQPRWNIWRVGGMNDADWFETGKWPRVPISAPPPPPVGLTVDQGHTRNIETRNLVNENLRSKGLPDLGPNAVLEIASDMSQAVKDGKKVPAAAIRQLLTDAGIS